MKMGKERWRPEGFSNPYDYKIPIPSLLDLDHAERNSDATKFLTHEAFEAGADAMLEALRKGGIEAETDYNNILHCSTIANAITMINSEGTLTNYNRSVKGHIVFIPDEVG